MALMIPAAITSAMIEKYSIPTSELKVFEELKRLPDEYTCVWSVPWADPEHTRRSGEADFLVIHPQFPLTIIEVKGGKISSNLGRWSRLTKFGIQLAESPIDQAHKSREALVRKFAKMRGFPESKFIPNAAIVILTDASRSSLIGEQGYYSFVMTVEDFPSFRVSLEETMRIPTDKLNRYNQGIGKANAAFITKFFSAQPCYQVPMRSLIDLDRDNLARISREHYITNNQLELEKKVVIRGRAGTGKTVLAIQKAVREAQLGRTTLLICFNEILASTLNCQVKEYGTVVQRNLKCVSYHHLCREICSQAGELPAGEKERPKEFFEELEVTAECIVLHESRISGQYETIIVDEGQDFKDSWWSLLEALIKKDSRGFFWIFMDESQNLQQRGEFPLDGFFKFKLLRNFRNSRTVFEFINRSELGKYFDEILPMGPAGTECCIVSIRTPEQMRSKLKALVSRLIQIDGLKPNEIVILSGKSLDNRDHCLFGETSLDDYAIGRSSSPAKGEIMLETIRRYKGLESKYVMLIEIDEKDPLKHETTDKLVYVGATRAVSGLAVFANSSTLIRLGWLESGDKNGESE